MKYDYRHDEAARPGGRWGGALLVALAGMVLGCSGPTETQRAFDYAMNVAADAEGGEAEPVDEDLVEPDPFDAPPTESEESTVVILAATSADPGRDVAVANGGGDDGAATVDDAEASPSAPEEAPAAAVHEAPTDLMVATAMQEHRRDFRRCYARATDGLLPRPSVTLDVTLAVAEDGSVAGLELAWRDHRRLPDLEPCLRRVARDLSFPGPFLARSEVSLPLVFDPGGR